MQCVTPMFRVFQKDHHETGRIISREKVLGKINYDPNYIRKQMARFKEADPSIGIEQIPCGQCWSCKLNYSAEWATRIVLECKKSEHNYFITLTYDADHLPICERVKLPTGEIIENDGSWTDGTLQVHDMETFINTLRKRFERKYKEAGLEPPKIKYFYAGEYGDGKKCKGEIETHRPHYHMILMNCPLDITQFYDCFVDLNHKEHWKSQELESIWQKGNIDVAAVEWSDAAYVARYCMKKIENGMKPEDYYRQGKTPEFIRMSKGIGFDYYRNHIDEIYNNDEIIMKTVKGNIGAVKPPKAFDRKLKEADPERFEKIRTKRTLLQERSQELLQNMTDLTDKKLLEMKREKVVTKAKMLPRDAIT